MAGRKPKIPDIEKQVSKLFQTGISSEEMGRRLGVAGSAIRRTEAWKKKIKGRKRVLDTLNPHEPAIRAALDRGESQNHIARRYDVSPSTLGSFLKNRGIKSQTQRGKWGSPEHCRGEKSSWWKPSTTWNHIPIEDYHPPEHTIEVLPPTYEEQIAQLNERAVNRRKAFDNADIRLDVPMFDAGRKASRDQIKRGLCKRCGERKAEGDGVCFVCRVVLRAAKRRGISHSQTN